MKLLGAALVAAAFAVLGASEALRLRRRARLTSELAAGLELLRGEIVSRLAPMPEAAERLARHGPEGTRVFYAAVCTGLESFGGAEFSELWRRALGLLDIGAPARAALLNLGASLGRYGAEEQGSACLLYTSASSAASATPSRAWTTSSTTRTSSARRARRAR